MTRDKIIPTLKVLHRIYTDKCHVEDISGINTFTFGIHTLYHDANYECSSTESSKILDYLVKFNYLKKISCQYYFTEDGFNLAFKSSQPYKYFHHTNWKFIYGVIGVGIITALATLSAPMLGCLKPLDKPAIESTENHNLSSQVSPILFKVNSQQ